MSDTNSAAVAQNLAVLAAWLQDPCHSDANRRAIDELQVRQSFRCISAASQALSDKNAANGSQSNLSSKLHPDSSPELSSEVNTASEEDHTALSLPISVRHAGVINLLDTLHKLAKHQARGESGQATNRYRPGLYTQLWHLLTAELHPALQFSNVMRFVYSILDGMAPQRSLFIVALLAVFMLLIRLISLITPRAQVKFIVVLVCLAIPVLAMSENKLHKNIKEQSGRRMRLSKFKMDSPATKNRESLLVAAYLSCSSRVCGHNDVLDRSDSLSFSSISEE